MKSIYDVFEFNQVKKLIEKYAKTELGLEKIQTMEMFEDPFELKNELSHLNEIISYTFKYRNLVITNHKNILPHLAIIKKGGTCGIDFFYQVLQYLENARILKDEVIKDENYPYLLESIRNLNELESLAHRLDRTITKDLEISDNASSALREIRRSLNVEISSQSKIINSLMMKYKDYLNDERVALRNASFTLPIKSTYKHRVDGITIDESDSGLTCFIEPTEIIASNNKIARLREKEKEEINRILDELSSLVKEVVYEIIYDVETICYLDFLLSKANYAIETDSKIAKLSDKKIINLKNARHPLIDKKKIVKNSFILDKNRIMLITGPNAGGKTVALKVIGLLVIMNQCGLALPTDDEAELSFFKNIFVDMGDNQSLIDNLSTFSGHIKNIIEIVDQISEDSLVIFDELGTGTSPLDGEALGIGVITYLHKVGAFAVLTSHYDGLKTFALENNYILNASMEFDEENIAPTYRLRLGVAGKSYGLEMSKRMGLNKEILDTSYSYIEDKRKTDKEITLALLQKRLEENESIQLSLKEKEEEINKRIRNLEHEKRNLLKLQDKIKEEAESEKQKIIEEAKEEIDKIFEQFKSKEDYKMHEVITAKRNLDLLRDYEEDEEESSYVPSINDYVRADDFNVTGKVIRIKGDNVTLLTDQGLNLSVKSSGLTKIKASKKDNKPKTYTPSYKLDKKVSLECNIVGYRVEEGLREIDAYLSDAIAARYSEVRLIHGSGTGKLRSAVHEYLKKRKDIKSFRLGGLGEGGVGATVVYLK
ncbi:MAG: endonuclease MutS2 [Erysipelotrichaceae bacterium]|nr:endonuclease MutS2 [Erysipelotrichaceae bacterium]